MLSCTIATATQTTSYPRLRGVTFPTSHGEVEILPKHAEAFFVLTPGSVLLDPEDAERVTTMIASGVCHVRDDQVMLIVSAA